MKRLIIIFTFFATFANLLSQTGNTACDTWNDTLKADTTALDTAAVIPWPLNVQQRIDELLENRMFETSQVGLLVYDLTADSAIFCRNERQMMRPASTMKILTAVAAIDRLGGSYRLVTSLDYTGTIDNGTLTGDLYCVGGFDPLFNSDDMKAFAESLRSMGVDTIRGRIMADKSMKDADRLGEGWCWDDDNPTLSPLLISRKDSFTAEFIDELVEAGVTLEVTLGEGSTPTDAHKVCSRFHTIDQVLIRMMKESDNLFAEALFYNIAAASGAVPAKASNARSAIRKVIGKTGLDGAAYKIADGSGLSLYNYVSVEMEVRLLRYAYQNSQIYVHLLPSLPVAGEDGTLKTRMKGSFAAGNVKAKTGTLTGISSLAGYCTAANGHTLCFAIINQGLMRAANGKAFQDRLCDALCRP